ncbi:MAG TPA: chemotaxis protein CheA [Candidatus Limnocylindria bacterium]|jgi:two-component system chemotaxis sensor kinase CheA|nr:chemotaxis protein CheA [Candidatus Limnocylindria bacterium]
MPDASQHNFQGLSGLTEKLSLELAFAEPGKDNGLLPANSFVSEMEEMLTQGSLPSSFGDAIKRLRSYIDHLFDTDGLFDAATLKGMGKEVEWLQAAVNAAETGSPEPASTEPVAESAPTPAASPTTTTPAVPPAPAQQDPQPMILNLGEDTELLVEFANESQEHLQNIELGVLTLEDNPRDADTLNSIFRAFHTFKGGSGFLNLKPINQLAHELESLLDQARQHILEIDSEIIEIILAGGDTLKQFVQAIETQLSGKNAGQPILIPTLDLLSRVRAVIAGHRVEGRPSAPPAATPVAQEKIVPMPVPVPAAKEISTSGSAPVPAAPPLSTEKIHSIAAAKQTLDESTRNNGQVVKVDTAKLDALVDLVGEMVIAQSLVAQDSELKAIQSQKISRNLAQLGRITKELQRISTALRMVPIRGMFQKMNRLVRDVALKAGKQVELVTDGEETELDRTIIEVINDPLVHMIRNSVDHGIEKPEARLKNGKSAQGKVTLRAFHQGGTIVIEIADDGGGLDRDRILAKAIERGLVKPDQNPSEKDIFALIFEPGFSTATVVTDLSGRGVGMDVVKRNIDKLRGKISIESTPGEGSKFSIHLPLTLAIIEGLMIGLDGHRFIIPTLSICESFRVQPGMLSTVHGRDELINVRGKLIPLLRLDTYFNLRTESLPIEKGIVVVVECDGQKRCLLVDQLIGKQEVVIKNLGETFKRNPCLAGAAILGDGRVGLILDVDALVKLKPVELAEAA